jgi:hypothetical protein
MADTPIPTTAEPAAPPSSESEQRFAMRHRCSLSALTRLYLPATGQRYFAWVHDLSVIGVAFDLRTQFEPGQVLCCQLKGLRVEECFEVRAFVVHVQLIDGLYRAGCQFFEPLPPECLEAVLRKLRS